MTETTKFLILVALAAGALGFALTQLLILLTRWEKRRLQMRLKDAFQFDLTPSFTPVLIQKRPEHRGPLGNWSLARKWQARIQAAYPDVTLGRFLTLVLLLGVVAGAAVYGLSATPVGAAMAAFLAASIPFINVNARRLKRNQQLNDQLVEALEFLARVLRAGHGLASGIQMLGQELPEPIAGEFRRCYDQHSLGQALEEAMVEMANRVDSTDFSFFVTSVLIQRQTGGDLAEILDKLCAMVRARIRLQQHVKAITAEGRLTGYILTLFPVVIFAASYVLNPEYAGTLLNTQPGQIVLVCGVIMQIAGLMFIRRIVNVKV